MWIHLCVHCQRLGHCEVLLHSRRLQNDADMNLQLSAFVAWVIAQDGDLASITSAIPFQDLHRRGLPCAIWPEKGKDLTRADGQIDACHGGNTFVGLLEPADLKGGG